MAEALVVGAVLGDVVSKSSSLILLAIEKTWYFESKLREMEAYVNGMRPIIKEIEKLNREMDRRKEETERINNMLQQADRLVLQCQKINWLFWKKCYYDSKLDDMNTSLRNYVNSDVTLQIARDVKLMYAQMMRASNKDRGTSSAAPLLKGVVIGFDNRVKDLKDMMLKDCPNDDCSVVVVSAAGGSGKTTFVELFCNDPEIKERFGKNIYFVTVSQNYNLKVVVTKLLGELPADTNKEDAIQQWGSFLNKNKSEILLVLDDVWSDEVINDFKFKLPRYKILVTSRITFKRFKTYQLQVLNDQDAASLFRYSAFSESENKDRNIPDDLVDKLIKFCKNHPLLLSVTGGLLKGEHVANWEFMRKKLYEEKISPLDLHESVEHCLRKNLYFFDKEPEMKQCYMDLGLFPEDQKIAATALLDIWAHLYKHDEGGLASFNILTKLSSRNLVTLLPIRKHIGVIANYCEEESVTQHDMLRSLAIQLRNHEPIEDSETLIINPNTQDHLQLPQTVNARVLSICTDERLPLRWNEIEAPKVEVFVLNYMSKIHPLPQFMHKIESLKVLIITNYGYYYSEILNFPAPQYLSGLTSIRLDYVSISTISTTILMLENLKKLSLIMCKIGNSFNEGTPNKLTSLLEIYIDSCDDFVTFPAVLCNSARLKKLSITRCHELISVSDEIGNLSNLEVLQVATCLKLTTLPEAVTNLEKLRIIDVSQCLNLHELPQHIGKLRSLRTINATGCMSLEKLPKSIENCEEIDMVCDEETSHRLSDFKNVKVKVVEKDPIDAYYKINPRVHQ